MRTVRTILFSFLALIALPMALGFASPELANLRWSRVRYRSERLLTNILSARPAFGGEEEEPVAIYRESLEALKSNYAGDLIDRHKAQELTYAAIRGMLYSLKDPFTSFLDPEQWMQMQQMTRGDFEGIGALLEQIGSDVTVVRVYEDSPALRAGIRPHDVVLSVARYNSRGVLVETRSMAGKSIDDVVRLIKGPQGTRVGVTLRRPSDGTQHSYALLRAHIEPPTVKFWMEDRNNRIGHILLNEFNEKSESQFDRAYQALQRQGMRALVFDLRYNPGGLLNVAVDITSRFIETGPAVIVQERNGQRQALRVRARVLRNHLPLAVLINESSASASEIVAGAIKDNGVGTLIGEHTFGKGLVQTLFPLGDGSALRLTTARYFTPKMTDINNQYDPVRGPIFGTGGIKPDVVVKQPEAFEDQDWSDANKRNDLQLKRALELLRTRLASRSTLQAH